MQSKHFSWLTVPLLLVCANASVLAQNNDTFKINASENITWDNNFYRTPNGISERINEAILDLSFNKAYGLQGVELGYKLIKYNYQNASDQNFTAHNYNAAWRWALTPRLTGNLSSDRTIKPNNYADNATTNKQLINTNTMFNGAYELAGSWYLLGGVGNSSKSNDSSADDYNDRSLNTGIRYVFSTGSTLSYTLNKAYGKLASSDNYDYTQTDNSLKLHWVITGQSTAELSASHISRTYSDPQSDFSGLNTSASLLWSLTGKTAMTTLWEHSRAPYLVKYDSNLTPQYESNYIQANRLSLGPVWQVGPKTVVRLRYAVAQLDYLGSPSGGLAPTQRSDTTHDTILSYEWQPHQRINLKATLQNSTRTSNQANLDFQSKQASLSAQLSY